MPAVKTALEFQSNRIGLPRQPSGSGVVGRAKVHGPTLVEDHHNLNLMTRVLWSEIANCEISGMEGETVVPLFHIRMGTKQVDWSRTRLPVWSGIDQPAR